MKVIVTGGAGFIGSHIVDSLIEQGHKVVVIDNLSTGYIYNVHPQARFYLKSITDQQIFDIFTYEKPDYVFHQAAQIDVQVSLKQPYFDAKVNILGTINILEACIKSGVKKIIYASSAAAYGEPEYLGINEQHRIDPISYYGISKHTPEHYLRIYQRQYRLMFTALRYANVYGIRQDPKGEGGVISIFIDRVLGSQNPIIFGDGNQTRDFVYVKDIVSANLAAIHNADGQILNIGTGIQTSINVLLETIKTITGLRIQANYAPERPGDIRHCYFNNAKAKELLAWVPRHSLEAGLRETIEYYSVLKKTTRSLSDKIGQTWN